MALISLKFAQPVKLNFYYTLYVTYANLILKFYSYTNTILPTAICLCLPIDNSSVPSPLTSACCLCCPPLLWSPWGWHCSQYRGGVLGHSAGALYTALGPEQTIHMTVLNNFFYLLHYVTVSSSLVCLLVSFHRYDL